MKKVLFIFFLLIWISSCEKSHCRMCKTQIFVQGKSPEVTTGIVCEDIQEGYFITPDSAGNLVTKMVACEK